MKGIGGLGGSLGQQGETDVAEGAYQLESLTLTTGVAFGTLLVAGGILLGPGDARLLGISGGQLRRLPAAPKLVERGAAATEGCRQRSKP